MECFKRWCINVSFQTVTRIWFSMRSGFLRLLWRSRQNYWLQIHDVFAGIWCCYSVLWTVSWREPHRETKISAGISSCCWGKRHVQNSADKQMHLSALSLAFLWCFQEISYLSVSLLHFWATCPSHWEVSNFQNS